MTDGVSINGWFTELEVRMFENIGLFYLHETNEDERSQEDFRLWISKVDPMLDNDTYFWKMWSMVVTNWDVNWRKGA